MLLYLHASRQWIQVIDGSLGCYTLTRTGSIRSIAPERCNASMYDGVESEVLRPAASGSALVDAS
jgi:hypothetical protein